MEYTRLGNTGLMVSELCLGCMTFGQEADEETSREIVGRFLDAGGNFLDTADVYSYGVSEEITGKYRRDEEPPEGSRISEAVESMEEAHSGE